MHFFSATVYSRGLKFLDVIYETFDYDLTQGFLDWFLTNRCDLAPEFWISAYVVHYFSATIYSRGLKFLDVIYETFDYDLTQGFLDSWLQ